MVRVVGLQMAARTGLQSGAMSGIAKETTETTSVVGLDLLLVHQLGLWGLSCTRKVPKMVATLGPAE